MKKALISRRLANTVVALAVLLYFAVRTASPKILFAPFLICGIASMGENLALFFERTEMAMFFDRFFKIAFFLSWFGFLIAVCLFAVREENYKVIFFTLPFWLGGLFFMKRKLLNQKR